LTFGLGGARPPLDLAITRKPRRLPPGYLTFGLN
jgi:hypothetical protein